MDKTHLSSLVAVGLAASAWADVFIGQNGFTNIVTAADETFSGRMVVSDQGELVKSGEGTLTVPVSSVNQSWPLAATVLEGTLKLDADSGTDLGAVRPAVMDIAALWVSAADTDETHFPAADGGGISAWYDVRETDVSSPAYLYAQTSYTFSGVTSPERVTTNGYKAVWFGGAGSGRAMNWYNPSGSRYTDRKVKHVFAVHGVLKSYGAIFSPGTDSGNACAFFTPLSYSHDYSVSHGYWRRDISMPYMWNGRTWLDGERIDGHGTLDVAKGFHLLEADAGIWAHSNTGGFFSQFKQKDYSGGDYLCEAVVFTNVLSEADRVQVGSYLMKKWFGKTVPGCRLHVADGAAFEISSENLKSDLRIDATGTGDIVKSGSGTVVYRAADWSAASTLAYSGAVRIEEGSLVVASQLPISVSAGQRVASEIEGVGRAVTVANDAEAGEIVKDGGDELVVASVPSEVKTLTVNEGSLTLRSPSVPDATGRTFATAEVPNGDFEGFVDSLFTDTTVPCALSTTETAGWKRISGNVWMVNWHNWTGSFWGKRSDWNFYVAPVSGECVLMVHQNGAAATTVEVPADGTWEFSCLRLCRAVDSNMGGYATVTLRDPSSGAVVATLGRIYSHDTVYRWKPVALRAKVAAGTYQLRIAHANNTNAMLIDDVKMRQVDAPEFWPLPGGDFETASMAAGYAAQQFTSENTVDGWTFSANEDSSVLNPPAGLVTFAMTNSYGKGAFYNDSRQPGGGFVTAYFRTDGSSAVTTFTPPAGKYRLKADFAHRCDTGGNVDATVTIGESTVSLGSVAVAVSAMTPMTFPQPFTSDGQTPVTLTVTANLGDDGIWADDFRLVEKLDDGELVQNGSFENGMTGWTAMTESNGGAEKGTYGHYSYANWRDQLGTDEVDGARYLMLWNLAGVKQTISFPEAGVYRLSFWQHTRLNKSYYGRNPVDTYLVKDSVTNIIGRSEAVTHTNFVQHVFDFRVPEAGDYTLEMRGTRDLYSMEAMIDGVSVVRVPQPEVLPDMLPGHLELSVEPGARLRLDFDGTEKIEKLRLGGHKVSGTVSAATHPEYISGRGVLQIDPDGTVVILR